MIRPLPFQEEAANAVVTFAREIAALEEMAAVRDPVAVAWGSLIGAQSARPYSPVINADGLNVPCVAMVVPTGGGKTLMGLDVATQLASLLTAPAQRLVLWVVPSQAIYDQVLQNFSPGSELAAFVDEVHGLRLNPKRIGDAWTIGDFGDDTLTVLVVTQQSIMGKREDLRFRRGADLVTDLPIWSSEDHTPSLAALVDSIQPVVVVDEAHRTYTEVGRGFFTSTTAARFIVELTATPRAFSPTEHPNPIATVSARALVDESLIKTPLAFVLDPRLSRSDLLEVVVEHRERLASALSSHGYLVTPKVLVSCEYTGGGHASEEYSAQSIRENLVDLGVPRECIKLKSSESDELEGIDLDAPECGVQFILTKTALREGWDVKSVFCVALVNGIGANTTTVQLIGRGLRQPRRAYFTDPQLNRLTVFANDGRQDEAVGVLQKFLDDQGLGVDFPMEFNGTPLGARVDLVGRLDVPTVAAAATPGVLNALVAQRFVPSQKAFSAAALLDVLELEAATIYIAHPGQEGTTMSQSVSLPEWNPDRWFRAVRLRALRRIGPLFSTAGQAAVWIDGQMEALQADPLAHRLLAIAPTRGVDALARRLEQDRELAWDSLYEDDVYPSGLVVRAVAVPDGGSASVSIASPSSGMVAFDNHVLGELPAGMFNKDELAFARHLDALGGPWLRNGVGPGWYSLPLPHHRHMYPDFLVPDPESLNPSDAFERVIAVETKGAHLLDSDDTRRKQIAAEEITRATRGAVTVIVTPFGSAVSALSEALSLRRGGGDL